MKYIETKFFHFLVTLRKNTMMASKVVYSFVPIQDFEEEWTDEKLYKKYGLTTDEVTFIESMIHPSDFNTSDDYED
jgi:site-specific DNA-methyltransferase (adenine-specific)